MPDDTATRNHDHRLTLFSVSAGMVGVYLTGVGLIGIIKGMRQIESVIDEILTVSALLFIVSTAFYFFALRRSDQSEWTFIDFVADGIFFL